MRYTHILLDADNTLLDFDSAERIALSESLRKFGYEPSERVLREYHAINDGWWKRFERGEVTMDQLCSGRFADLAQKFGFSYDAQEFHKTYERVLGEHGELRDGALDFVTELHKRGCRLYIITNGSIKVQRPRIENSPIRQMIDQVYISMEVGHKKPEREYFEHVLGEIDADHSRILVVGDSLRSDISGGAGVGLDTCWYSPDRRKPRGEVQPTYVARNYDDILQAAENGIQEKKPVKRNVYRAVFTTLTLLLLCFIFGNSAADGEISGGLSEAVANILDGLLEKAGFALRLSEHIVRKAAHFTEYSALGALLTATVRVWRRAQWRFCAVWLPLVFGLLTASADEYLQTFVPGRSGHIYDVALDFSGVLWAAIAASIFLVARKARSADRN